MTFFDEAIYDQEPQDILHNEQDSTFGHKERQMTYSLPTLLVSAATMSKVKPCFDVTTSSHCDQLSGSRWRYSKLSSLSATTPLTDLYSLSTVLCQTYARKSTEMI